MVLPMPPGEWVTVATAAEQLGMSIDAIRSRIRRGRLDSRRVEDRVLVRLPSQEESTGIIDGAAGSASNGDISTTLAPMATTSMITDYNDRLVAPWQARVEQLTAELNASEHKRGQLQEKLATQRAINRALEAMIARLMDKHEQLEPDLDED